MGKCVLKLYITGRTPASEQAVLNIKSICEHKMPGRYQLVIIDILEQPEIAERDGIIATPTLIKEQPQPVRRIIGDLSETNKVLAGLNLPASQPAEANGGS